MRSIARRAAVRQAYTVYILQCGDGTLYTGITTDLALRLKKHRAGTGARYTRSRGVERVLYTERRASRSAALVREAAIKRLTRAQKLQLVGTGKMRKTS